MAGVELLLLLVSGQQNSAAVLGWAADEGSVLALALPWNSAGLLVWEQARAGKRVLIWEELRLLDLGSVEAQVSAQWLLALEGLLQPAEHYRTGTLAERCCLKVLAGWQCLGLALLHRLPGWIPSSGTGNRLHRRPEFQRLRAVPAFRQFLAFPHFQAGLEGLVVQGCQLSQPFLADHSCLAGLACQVLPSARGRLFLVCHYFPAFPVLLTCPAVHLGPHLPAVLLTRVVRFCRLFRPVPTFQRAQRHPVHHSGLGVRPVQRGN